MGDVKTPEEYATKEISKSLGKAIAKRELEIKKFEAKIKKIRKEIDKIKSGELVPDEDDSSSSSSSYHTIVNFILDESGSMYSRQKETVDGFNEYIQKLKKDKCKVSLTLTKFNDNVTVVFKNKSINDVKEMTSDDYKPDMCTALYDAIGITAQKLGKIKDNEKALFIIITDGYENMSKEFKLVDIKSLIKDKEKEGWTFTFLGGDLDAKQEGSNIGVASLNTLSFASRNIGGVMRNLGGQTTRFACSGSRSTNSFFGGKKRGNK
ncbi:unnamed protein product [marine sediment metagenome]|uniref:VWFA domain-containing protein n=1 Tax=marine sediment metagenome TaxID=412755 RepID=X0S4A4_9ZZZZ